MGDENPMSDVTVILAFAGALFGLASSFNISRCLAAVLGGTRPLFRESFNPTAAVCGAVRIRVISTPA
jgi:hypothetical protein